ncbi:hypothetical protein SXCC_00638 [Gluconacetobacter sp. SXCC-1]|uniref:Uncharacterized protein n=1 Tax=Novacetimonas maltaceti TaxID=1203393 RepID=A0A2S3VY85_9PROT|nr:hypothetical protein [Novacetimonas maltaceti]EGG78657.1 hypothetical protein SXCC_00638 [Gluconacetobacter sp. SXCC-1]POF61581.1 hypothetical protein KMAL_28000 [Novacetimonas maltaceti]PYD58595.1 hypothetical protein CFR73_14485 [Novacetimonas maltaceti]GCE89052.1 hypothetical protein MSKU15_0653 [Komagataeibacter diospyri]
MSEPCISLADIRSEKLCMAGAREWFRTHGLSWNDAVQGRITLAQITATHDPLGERVVTAAKKRLGLQ